MKFFITILLIAALSFAACLFLPWWVIAITAFIVAFAIPQKAELAFLAGFTALFILWAGMSFYMSSANGNLFVHKMSILFLKMDNPTVLYILTGLIGGLVAGFGSLSGRLLKKMMVKN
jgi:hypothetical protein